MNMDVYKEYRKMQIENQEQVKSDVSPETWAKMDRYDRDFYLQNKNNNLPEEARQRVDWSIYDHKCAANWDVVKVLTSFVYQKPNCKECGKNDSMVKHSDGKWVCHHTHKI